MILYTGNPKDVIRKLLELINKFGKAAVTKLIHRNLWHFYTLKTKDQKEKFKKQSHYHCIKKNKIPRNKPPKETKDLYSENYKTLMKEIEEDTNRWKDIPCCWIGRITTVKMTILPKAIYRYNAISIKLPMAFLWN